MSRPDMRNVRPATCHLIESAEEGILTWEAIARECLSYMSEADVADMAEGTLIDMGDEDEEDEAC